MSAGYNFTANVSGSSNAQINQGQHVNASQNNGSEAPPSVDEILEVIEESVPEESREEMKTEVIEPLRALAALPIVEQKEPTMVQKANALIGKLSPFAPQIARGLAVFGSAFFKASPITGPWIAGIQALCEKVQSPEKA